MSRLVLATKNPGKVEEMREILEASGLGDLQILSCADFPWVSDVEEDGETFVENAMKKALAVSKATGEVALADDSGLEVDALGGAPGVRSARFAGEYLPAGASRDKANCDKLLSLLEGVPVRERTARFRCVVAVASPLGQMRTAEGECAGTIAFEPRGSSGFGYDPIFVPEGYEATFGELGFEAKNQISHRARALRAAVPAVRDLVGLNALKRSRQAPEEAK
ncbi:MAG: XTP/dITP diphosphatase [Firmicutes bacterium]|jgi:XTP/dITP diphosphohydrolase|nr:XTP/dITP diphosphatase [Bacillota bacterium]MDH7494516.1 XTP/dITP diphosphatase [Bacillota bacterium]